MSITLPRILRTLACAAVMLPAAGLLRSAVRCFRLKEFAWAICRLMKSWFPANANIFRMRKFQKSRICKNCKNRPPWHKILWFLAAFLFDVTV